MGLLIIMRGVPGSGKSYRAKELVGDHGRIFSTDEWFERQEGGYVRNWHPDKLFPAHRWNQERVREAIARGVTPVIVDNTNLQMKYAKVYYQMAMEAGYEVQIEEANSPWWLEIKSLLTEKTLNDHELKKWAQKLAHGFHATDGESSFWIRNEHGVPPETIFNMLMNYSPYTVAELHLNYQSK